MMTDLSDISDRPGGVGFNMSDREAFGVKHGRVVFWTPLPTKFQVP